MELILELNADEIKLCLFLIRIAQRISPRDSTNKRAIASLIKRFSDALEDPQKHHAYNKPRRMSWTRKVL